MLLILLFLINIKMLLRHTIALVNIWKPETTQESVSQLFRLRGFMLRNKKVLSNKPPIFLFSEEL